MNTARFPVKRSARQIAAPASDPADIPFAEVGFQGFMLRTPSRRARMANCLARSSPYLRMENSFLRATYGSGLHVACQYFRHGLVFRLITRCTPWIPERPFRRWISAHHRRLKMAGGPKMAVDCWWKSRAAASAAALPPYFRSVKKAE